MRFLQKFVETRVYGACERQVNIELYPNYNYVINDDCAFINLGDDLNFVISAKRSVAN